MADAQLTPAPDTWGDGQDRLQESPVNRASVRGAPDRKRGLLLLAGELVTGHLHLDRVQRRPGCGVKRLEVGPTECDVRGDLRKLDRPQVLALLVEHLESQLRGDVQVALHVNG